MKKLLLLIIPAVLIVASLIFSYYSPLLFWGNMTNTPYTNDYQIPESIPEYQVISTGEKTDWKAHWIWDKENLTEENTWMCFNKKINLENKPEELIAHISADSKYWLYINGETVVFEGSVKRGPSENSCYYDSIDVAPYLQEGENSICALVWYWDDETSYSYNSSGQGGFIFEAINDDITIISDNSWKVKKNDAYGNSILYKPNYRLPEHSIYYDATKELGDWTKLDYDASSWENATEYAVGGEGVYGRLYPWTVAMNLDPAYNKLNATYDEKIKGSHQGICPEGWHLPTADDWRDLTTTAKSEFGDDNGSLRAVGQWENTIFGDNVTATNASGFSALPAGYHAKTGECDGEGTKAYFWGEDNMNHYAWILSNQYDMEKESMQRGYYAYAVRCVKD